MSADERKPGEAFCGDCPDHEACATGYPCDVVKAAHVRRHCGRGICAAMEGHAGTCAQASGWESWR